MYYLLAVVFNSEVKAWKIKTSVNDTIYNATPCDICIGITITACTKSVHKNKRQNEWWPFTRPLFKPLNQINTYENYREQPAHTNAIYSSFYFFLFFSCHSFSASLSSVFFFELVIRLEIRQHRESSNWSLNIMPPPNKSILCSKMRQRRSVCRVTIHSHRMSATHIISLLCVNRIYFNLDFSPSTMKFHLCDKSITRTHR